MRRVTVRFLHLADVAGDRVRVVGEIRAVGLLAVTVPLAGENAMAADGSKPRRSPPMPAKRSMKVKAAALAFLNSRLAVRPLRVSRTALRGRVSPAST